MAGETYTTYDQVGIAEDISEVITNISPTKTPFQTAIGTEKVSNRMFQWQEDTLRAPAANKSLEGFVASDVARVPTSLRTNYTQILSDTFRVSATADAVRTYGRAKETAYQLAKVGEELKRDLEYAMVGTNANYAAGDEASTPRAFATAFYQIDSNNIVTTDSDAGTGGNQAGPITETNLLNCHRKIYDAGGDPDTLMVKPADALIIASFSSATGRLRDIGGGKTITNVVDLYVSPWGELKVMINRWQLSTAALLFSADMWSKCVLRNWSRVPLAVDGDAQRHMVVGEFSLKHKNWKSAGYIANLT